jgi:hypothetical protein
MDYDNLSTNVAPPNPVLRARRSVSRQRDRIFEIPLNCQQELSMPLFNPNA